ncbi:MAG: hypothetical protein II580_06885 [Bacteroidales bacterium]|nr:hypothetical protein [Bacteroidales bacterium]
MQRLITLLTTCAVVLGAFTSCNLDKDYTFEYTNEAVISIKDETDKKAVEDYMKANFIEQKNTPTYFGKYYDAQTKFIQHFLEEVNKVDKDLIYSHLTDENDFVRFIGRMKYGAGDDWVGYMTWKATDPRQTETTPKE